MDAKNIKEMHGNIYDSQVNGIIPWAGIQRPGQWVGGDPNPGSAFTVHEDGSYEVQRGYYFYKQVSRAGQPGMAVARTMSMDSQVAVIGFSSNGTKNPDAAVVVNWDSVDKMVALNVIGTNYQKFEAFMTTEGDKDQDGKIMGNGVNYLRLGEFVPEKGLLLFNATKGSVITFFGKLIGILLLSNNNKYF